MSQLLAALNGPAFYPLPGIGRVFKVFDQSEVAGINSQKMKEYLDVQSRTAIENRETIQRLVHENDRTIAELMKLTELSHPCIKRHLAQLQKVGITKRRVGVTVYFCSGAKDA